LAMNGSMRRVRLAAAAALGARLPEEATKLVQGALSHKDDVIAAAAAEALSEIRHESAKERLRTAALSAKSAYVRREAAQSLGSLKDAALARDLEGALKDPDLLARAGAIEGLARIGEPRAIAGLLGELQDPKSPDIMERRAISAIRRILWTVRGTEEANSAYRKVVDAYRNEKGGLASARLARLLGSLARAAPPNQGKVPAAGTPTGVPGDSSGSRGEPDPGAADPNPTPAPAAADPPAEPAAPPPARNAPALLEGDGPVGDPAEAVRALIDTGMAHADPVARRAAAWALGRVGGEEALVACRTATGADKDELVRFHALRTIRRWKTARDEDAFQAFVNVLQYDKSWVVREEAAVALGVKGLEGARETLLARVQGDAAWQVVCAAAVSLGKTRDPKAVESLVPFLTAKDWKVRGAAAAGVGWANRAESIPPLIPLLADPEPSVARTAWEFLKRLADKDLPMKQKDWEAWWAENGKNFQILDREKEIRDARKYGYALNDRDVYENLDVVVLTSRGDSIENLLGTLNIKHRLTKSASVKKDGLQPFGVFVSNCTGEVQPDDHERICWSVHVGAALFGSCWAIEHTIGKEFGTTIRKFRGFAGEVLYQPRAEELPTESEYLNGVFPPLVRPLYELWGAHLIEVLDPERVEVLIDSPETAANFKGCGNLAAWFTAGHGVVMGSSAHFDRQKMSKLQNAWGVDVKTDVQRRAFAVDHFGFSWERVRELDAKDVFAKQAEAEKEVTDMSAFRFLTNFVRRKRIIDL
ncbi:MAG TPA: HEAT repeat domain-containing protein, partial [Planctomycetota bacterium]|nr:HEAT repeat domain-containing protein [Planctomycetota bacterium]